jgi:hypothetical protein
MARRRRSRSLKGLGFIAGMSGTQLVIGAAIGAFAMHYYMKKTGATPAMVEEKAVKAVEKAAEAVATAQEAIVKANDAAAKANGAVAGLGYYRYN